jgi:hypothetical protein
MTNDVSYLGQLVVLQTKWNLRSDEIGIVVEEDVSDIVLVMWTTKRGFELKKHVRHALLPITSRTLDLVKERLCIFK